MATFQELLALGGLATGAYGYDTLQKNLKSNADTVRERLDTAEANVTGTGAFKPYSVTTPLGSMTAGAGGLNFGQETAQAVQARNNAASLFGSSMSGDSRFDNTYGAGNTAMGSNFTAAQTMRDRSLQDRAGREQDIYGRIRDMQRPGEERAYDTMNSGLFGSGRGGMTSSAYGGSPEQFAFGKAQAEARNQASLQAMGQAQTEMMNQGNLAGQYSSAGMNAGQLQNAALQAQMQNQLAYGQLGNQMFQNQFVPGQELREFGKMGLQNSATQSASAQNMAGLLAQMGIGRATTDVNFTNAESQNLVGLLRMLGGLGGGV